VLSENITAKVRYGSQTNCLDSNITHYLASKGLPADATERLIIKGFQDSIFNLVKPEGIREEVEQLFNTQE
jgi:Fe-S cluster assembly scaffold protein SufB